MFGLTRGARPRCGGGRVYVAISGGQLRRDQLEYADRLVSFEERDDFARLTPERLAAAIDEVAEQNGTLPPDEWVRLLSVSMGYRDEEFVVVDAALGHATVCAPAHHRTVAGHHHVRRDRYDPEGGDSEWPPYLSGVLVLARALAATGGTAVLEDGTEGGRR